MMWTLGALALVASHLVNHGLSYHAGVKEGERRQYGKDMAALGRMAETNLDLRTELGERIDMTRGIADFYRHLPRPIDLDDEAWMPEDYDPDAWKRA
jgi:hypothetical protein